MTDHMGKRQSYHRRRCGVVNAKEAADILGVSHRTVVRMWSAGKMPAPSYVTNHIHEYITVRLRVWKRAEVEAMAAEKRGSIVQTVSTTETDPTAVQHGGVA